MFAISLIVKDTISALLERVKAVLRLKSRKQRKKDNEEISIQTCPRQWSDKIAHVDESPNRQGADFKIDDPS